MSYFYSFMAGLVHARAGILGIQSLLQNSPNRDILFIDSIDKSIAVKRLEILFIGSIGQLFGY